MLARTDGNMADVYAEFWRMQAIAESVEPGINQAARLCAALEAEIGDDQANWYLVQTFPGDDLKAMRNLARRRFGVFRATQERQQRRNETGDTLAARANVSIMEPIFAGWLFVFTWNIRKVKHRILACPGVMGLLCQPDTNEPITVQDRFVETLRTRSWEAYSVQGNPAQGHVVHNAERHIARQQSPTKRQRLRLDRLRKSLKRAGKWSQSTSETLAGLAPGDRITLMEHYLQGPA